MKTKKNKRIVIRNDIFVLEPSGIYTVHILYCPTVRHPATAGREDRNSLPNTTTEQ